GLCRHQDRSEQLRRLRKEVLELPELRGRRVRAPLRDRPAVRRAARVEAAHQPEASKKPHSSLNGARQTVGKEGLEPSWPQGRQILSPLATVLTPTKPSPQVPVCAWIGLLTCPSVPLRHGSSRCVCCRKCC